MFKTAQAVIAVAPPATAAADATLYSFDRHVDILADKVSHFHVTNRRSQRSPSPSPYRSRNNYRDSRSDNRNYNRGRRPSTRSNSRDRRSDRSRRSNSRDTSRDRGSYQRYPTPGRSDKSPKRVNFGASSSLECYYCRDNHAYAECPHLRKALQDGSISHDKSNF